MEEPETKFLKKEEEEECLPANVASLSNENLSSNNNNNNNNNTSSYSIHLLSFPQRKNKFNKRIFSYLNLNFFKK